MATFVLVHGAWSGAHGFRHVRRSLTRRGHDVFTPSLTGIGERVHLASPSVGLHLHVDDLVNHVLYEDLDAIVLLGFSYGGMVVTGALDALADRVGQLVYLDAFVPADGDSLFGLLGLDDRPPPSVGADWQVMAAPRVFDDASEADFMNPRRVPQPVRCFTERVSLSQPLEEFACGRTYIRATGDVADAPGTAAFEAAADHARTSPHWNAREIGTNHMVPSNRPDELATILDELA
ncbi:MAG: alpha/beta hydrolase [Ilumatobacteraceae bacterium]